MNKILKITVLCLATSSAFANLATQDANMADGFYGGLGLGVLSDNVQVDINAVRTLNEKIGSTLFMGQLYLGYQKQYNSDYGLQIEGFIDYRNYKQTYSRAEEPWHSSFSSKGIYGIKVMPFYKVSNTAKLFVDIGFAYSHFKHQVPQFCVDLGVPESFSKSLSGLVLGAGSEIALSKQLSIRGEYQYINFSKWNITGPLGGGMSYHPKDSLFVASMVYRMA